MNRFLLPVVLLLVVTFTPALYGQITIPDVYIEVCASSSQCYDLTTHSPEVSTDPNHIVTWFDGDPNTNGTPFADQTCMDFYLFLELWVEVREGPETATAQVEYTLIPDNGLGAVAGLENVCQNNSYLYSVQLTAPGYYIWTVPPGAEILSGQGTTEINVDFNQSTGGDICVELDNVCGISEQSCISVSQGISPNVPQIDGSIYEHCLVDLGDYIVANGNPDDSYVWTVQNGTILNGQGTSAIQVDWLDGYNGDLFGLICVTVSNDCGSRENCIDVLLEDFPQIDELSGTFDVCPGATVEYIAESYGANNFNYFYEWTVPNGATIVSSNAFSNRINVEWAADAIGGEVCVRANNICGFSFNQCRPVTVNPIQETVVSLTICEGECVVLNGTNYCDTGIYVETLISDLGCDSMVTYIIDELALPESNIDIELCQGACYEIQGTSFCQPGVYQEIIVGGAATGCDSIVNLTLTYNLNQIPQIDAYIENGFGFDCNTTETTLVAFSSLGGVSYHWDGPGLENENEEIVVVNQVGTYTLTVTTVFGCSNEMSIYVPGEFDPIDVNIIADNFDCSTDEIILDLDINTFLDLNTLTYLWQGPGITEANQDEPFPSITIPGTYAVTVIGDNSACNGSTTIEVLVADEVPQVLGVNNVSHCANGTNDIPPLSVLANSSLIIEWYEEATGGNFVALGTTYDPLFPGTYYVELVNPVTLCRSLNRTAVTFELVNPQININNTFCEPGLQTYGATFSSSEVDSVSTTLGTVSEESPDSYAINGVSTSTSFVITYGNKAADCYNTITVDPIICDCSDADIAAPAGGGDVSICEGDDIVEICSSVITGHTIDWYDVATGGTALEMGTDCFTPTTSGVYYAEARDLNSACVSNERTTVSIDVIPLPTYTFASVCSEDFSSYSVTISTMLNTNVTASVGTITDLNDGSFIIQDIPVGENIEGVIVGNETGCTTSFSITAPVCECETIDPPIGSDIIFCEGDEATISVVINGDRAIRWYDQASGGTLISSNVNLSVNQAGIYYVEAVDNATGCVSERTAIVASVATTPIVDAGADQQINCFDGSTVVLGSASNTGLVYSWVGPDEFSSTDAMPTVMNAGTYTLTIVNEEGCEASDELTITETQATFSTTTTFASCGDDDGTATIEVSGINNPNISWDNGATTNTIEGLAEGDYQVNIAGQTCDTAFVVRVEQDPACLVTISGYVFNDDINEDCDPSTSVPIADYAVRLLPLDIFVNTDESGYYEFNVDPGVYTLEVVPTSPFGMVCPSGIVGSSTVVALNYGDVKSDNNFFLKVNNNFDLSVNAFSGGAFPGQLQYYQFYYCNYGNESVSGELIFTHDALLSGFDMDAAGASAYDEATQTAVWKFTDLEIFECFYINFFMMVSPDGAGSVIFNHVEITPITGDINPFNNEYDWQQTIISNEETIGLVAPNPGSQTLTSEYDETIVLGQNIPNPFNNLTIIPMQFAKDQFAKISVFDLSGKVLKVIERDFVKGYNEVIIHQEELATTGLLFYTLETEYSIKTKKMLILD